VTAALTCSSCRCVTGAARRRTTACRALTDQVEEPRNATVGIGLPGAPLGFDGECAVIAGRRVAEVVGEDADPVPGEHAELVPLEHRD
jgi:hypothetical protein